ncbi:MAG: hypothetical protein AAGL24_10500 [Pseudomonadota bacterium]
MMDRQPYLIGVLAFGIVSGLFSPLTPIMGLWLRNFLPAFFVATPAVLVLVAALFTATTVIMVAGVPAALYERLTGKSESTPASLWIWVAATAALSLPAIVTVIQVVR